jgi:hypothetical protein
MVTLRRAIGRMQSTTDLSQYPNAVVSKVDEVPNFIERHSQVILKPSVSAGAHLTLRIDRDDITNNAETRKVIDEILAIHNNADVMVQPFLHSVTTFGEVSMIYISNKFVHAIRKVPKNGDYRVQKMHGARYEAYQPNEGDFKFGESVISAMKATIAENNPKVRVINSDRLMRRSTLMSMLYISCQIRKWMRCSCTVAWISFRLIRPTQRC